jgi:putative flippase GtrA
MPEHFLKRWLSNRSLFRYGMAAAIATMVDILVYFLVYNFVLRKTDVQLLPALIVSAPTAALAFSYSCGLITNFTITRFYVFPGSPLRTRIQLMRYVMVALFILGVNYLLMTFFIRGLHWFPTLSRTAAAVLCGFASFGIHRIFSFRGYVSMRGQKQKPH